MKSVYLSLGSNIKPEVNLPRGANLLAQRVKVVACSRIWQTPPEGIDGPIFLNAAAHIQTPLDAQTLKWEVLRPLEAALGRVRGPDKFAPRPLDLDILIYDGEILDNDIWHHPHLAVPLAELLPDLPHPQSGDRLAEIARRLQPPTGFFPRQDVLWEP